MIDKGRSFVCLTIVVITSPHDDIGKSIVIHISCSGYTVAQLRRLVG